MLHFLTERAVQSDTRKRASGLTRDSLSPFCNARRTTYLLWSAGVSCRMFRTGARSGNTCS